MTSCVSTFAILSPRGDTIISRQYRDDTGSVHSTSEIFFRASKFGLSEAKKEESSVGSASKGEETPPVFNVDGVNYVSLKTSGLYFVTTTRYNVSPTVVLELLSRLAKSCRDFCGVLTEESIRKNFVLVYEVLDEVLDYGYPLQTSTEVLKNMIYNEPIVVNPVAAAVTFKVPTPGGSLGGSGTSKARMAPSSSVNKSVLTANIPGRGGNTLGAAMGLQRFSGQTSTARNEIFVDILERVTCLFNASGVLLNAELDGSIIMKSFLVNNPELRVALNEDLVIGKHNLANVYAAGVVLDDCSFHECVRLDEFEELKSLVFIPPEGEFTLMNYRLTSEVRPPFRISPAFEPVSGTQVDLVIRVRADIPQRNYGSNVKVRFPVPKNTSGVSLITGKASDSAGQTAEYLPQDQRCEWTIKKFQGQTEHVLKARVTLKDASVPPQMLRREMGPVAMDFEIPMLSTSNLQVRYLRVAQQGTRYEGANSPHRWVRYITTSNSYACRL